MYKEFPLHLLIFHLPRLFPISMAITIFALFPPTNKLTNKPHHVRPINIRIRRISRHTLPIHINHTFHAQRIQSIHIHRGTRIRFRRGTAFVDPENLRLAVAVVCCGGVVGTCWRVGEEMLVADRKGGGDGGEETY